MEPEAQKAAAPDPQAAARVWVLAASIGGPQAVKDFLGALPPDLPVGFLLAQQVSKGLAAVLAEQLGRLSGFAVKLAHTGAVLRERQVILAPVEEHLSIGPGGEIHLHAPRRDQRQPRFPMDSVMFAVANHYRTRSGAIIFSGMGSDGVKGCRAIQHSGGAVWAQDAASALISTLPELARQSGTVSFSSSPVRLAARLTAYVAGCAVMDASG